MGKKYITVREAAAKWNISDRRVRVLCQTGKVEGAFKDGKSYKIPFSSYKPSDGRKKKRLPAVRFLKWADKVVGEIDDSNAVYFIEPRFNTVVSLYTQGHKVWKPEQLNEFLSERIVSRDRRDIEKILFRCGLSYYDVMRIAEITRGMHPKDLLWISNTREEKFSDTMTYVFDSVFKQKIDLVGDSLDTPEGYNIKRYGVYNGQYGIYKQRINPLTTDVESEIAVFKLAQKMGVPCCPAYRIDKDTIFSTFLYDFSKEYIVHFRRLFEGERSDNEYQNLITVRPEYKEEISRMILLDFITRQDDRHLSNIAIKITISGESFYPLYDNGRSLFYEDTEDIVKNAILDPKTHATTFGFVGTYWDYICEIANERGSLKNLLNLTLEESEILSILKESGFTDYRLYGATEWIMKTIKMVKSLY